MPRGEVYLRLHQLWEKRVYKWKNNDSLATVPHQLERERTLLTEVENHRTNLMVVLAGYKALIVMFASSPHCASAISGAWPAMPRDRKRWAD